MTTSTMTPAAGMTRLPAAGTNWQAAGLCREVDTDLFFPEPGTSAAPAKRICTACEVRVQCLEYALAAGERGVWGATTDNQRRAILRARKEEPAPVVDLDKDDRDATILRLTSEDKSAADIAAALGICARTVTRVRVAARKQVAA